MRVIIAGSRDFEDFEQLAGAVRDSGFRITEVVSGCARGADLLGEVWAEEQGIPVKKFPAEWEKFGKMAGPIRNRRMAQYAQGLIALWDGSSRGTENMIQLAQEKGIPVHIHRFTYTPSNTPPKQYVGL